MARQTFLYAYLCSTRLWLLLCRRVLVLLHAQNLCDGSVIGNVDGNAADLQHGWLLAAGWWGEVEMWRHVPKGEAMSLSHSHHGESVRDLASD